jgi:predicted RNase H-like HicB family nuclease
MTNYLAIVHKDHNSDFGVSFPDFPGCVTAGSTLDEAKDMAHDALSLHVKGMLEDQENLPVPSKLEDIIDNPDYSDAAAILVISVSEEKSRTVRVNITLPENMLRKIDMVAKHRGMSRSSFLVHAAENALTAPNKNNSSSQPV